MKQLLLNIPEVDYNFILELLKRFPQVDVTDGTDDYQFTEKQKNTIRAIDKKHKSSEYKSVDSVKKSLARKHGF